MNDFVKKLDDEASGGSESGGAATSGSADPSSSAILPAERPVVDATTNAAPANTNGNTNDAASQGEGRERVKSEEPKVEATQEEKSFATEFNKARVQALGLGLTDAAQLDNYAASVANKTIRGERVNPVEEVRNVAGPMAAAVAQASIELQLNTPVAMSNHDFVGGGVRVWQQETLAPAGPGGR